MRELDAKGDMSELGSDEKFQRKDLLAGLRLLNQNQEALDNQKAKVKRLQLGHKNSKYFHSIIKWRRTRDAINGLRMNENWCEDPVIVKNEAQRINVSFLQFTDDNLFLCEANLNICHNHKEYSQLF